MGFRCSEVFQGGQFFELKCLTCVDFVKVSILVVLGPFCRFCAFFNRFVAFSSFWSVFEVYTSVFFHFGGLNRTNNFFFPFWALSFFCFCYI